MFTDIKTTLGGLMALVALGLLIFHKLSTQDAVYLIGAAASWIGITGADAKDKNS
jgi:hypothetical protein